MAIVPQILSVIVYIVQIVDEVSEKEIYVGGSSRMKQCPELRSTLRKQLYFYPGERG